MKMKKFGREGEEFFCLLGKQRRKHPFLLFKHFCLCVLLPLAHQKKKKRKEKDKQNVSCWNLCVD